MTAFALANKCDMEEKRMISTARGQEIATQNNIKFYETSAKNNQNINDAFVTLAEDILSKVSKIIEVFLIQFFISLHINCGPRDYLGFLLHEISGKNDPK